MHDGIPEKKELWIANPLQNKNPRKPQIDSSFGPVQANQVFYPLLKFDKPLREGLNIELYNSWTLGS